MEKLKKLAEKEEKLKSIPFYEFLPVRGEA